MLTLNSFQYTLEECEKRNVESRMIMNIKINSENETMRRQPLRNFYNRWKESSQSIETVSWFVVAQYIGNSH